MRQRKSLANDLSSILMRAVTWSRDSHGLFDYESRHIQKKNLKTQASGKMFRTNNEIDFQAPDNPGVTITPDSKHLLSIINEDGITSHV